MKIGRKFLKGSAQSNQANAVSTSRPAIPLALMLVTPFVVQTFIAVGLVGYLSFKNGQRAINDLAHQLEREVSARVDQHLDTYLALPHQINQLNLDAIDRGLLNLRDIESTGRYFWKQSQVFEQFSYLGYSLSDLTGAGAGRWLEGHNIVISHHPTGRLDENTYAVDRWGNRTALVLAEKYDAVKDDWYTQTAAG